MAFNGADIDDLDKTTPDGSVDAPSTLDDAIREIKTVYKNQNAVISKTTTYIAGSTDSVILCDATGGAFTVTLPAVADVSSSTFIKEYTFIKVDSSANAVTIDGNSSETIDGAATYAISNQYQSLDISGDGTEWFTNRTVKFSGADGSQAVAAGTPFLPPTGDYYFAHEDAGTTLRFEVQINSVWFLYATGASTDRVIGPFWCDGTNMRLTSTSGTITVRFFKRD